MKNPEARPRLFTVEEAHEILPKVRQCLYSLRKQRDSIRRMEEKKAIEELSWLREDGSVSPKAQQAISRIEKLLESGAKTFEADLEEFSQLGAQLKDLDEGLIDFFTARGDALVYLCWKDGEDRIRFWHDVNSGFAGRRPLEEF